MQALAHWSLAGIEKLGTEEAVQVLRIQPSRHGTFTTLRALCATKHCASTTFLRDERQIIWLTAEMLNDCFRYIEGGTA